MVVLVNDRQLLNLVLLKDISGFLKRHFRGGDQVLASHHFADGTIQTAFKTEVTVRDDTFEAVMAVDHRNTTDMVLAHQVECISHRGIHVDGDGIRDHAVFSTFYLSHLGSLFANGHILVKHTDTTLLRNGNGHAGFGHGIHACRDNGNIQLDVTGKLGLQAGFTGKNVTIGRDQEHIVIGQTFANKFIVIV